MNIKESLQNLFGKKSSKPVADESQPETIFSPVVDEVNPRVVATESPLITFYRLGPDFLTWEYPVNTDAIDKYIFCKDDSGAHGAVVEENGDKTNESLKDYYAAAGALPYLEDYDNDWFCEKGRENLNHRLRSDLLRIAEEHHEAGAYTLIGSLCKDRDEAISFFQKAAQLGVPEGQVTYGMYIIFEHEPEKGFEWMLKGAAQGNEIGMLSVALSFHYGIASTIDYAQAAYWYRRLISEHKNFFAMENLGTMYAEANYFHTALQLFSQADAQKDSMMERLKHYGQLALLKNLESCCAMLKFSLKERKGRSTFQHHAADLWRIFFCDEKPHAPVFDSLNNPKPVAWKPDDMSEVDPMDLEEHKADPVALPIVSKVKYPHDDFVFPKIVVHIRNSQIKGNQHELIFLEKNVHAELNQFIQDNLERLRLTFKHYGYVFTYLPVHFNSDNDDQDIIGQYYEEYGVDEGSIHDSYRYRAGISEDVSKDPRNELLYWKYLFAEENLPDDCAGFLRYTPRAEINSKQYDSTRYDYFLFPYRPGTNWEKAFSQFVDMVASLPYVTPKHRKEKIPTDYKLLVDEQYHIFLVDALGAKKEEIKMPPLSKALYLLFLHHPQGFLLKDLMDYREELADWYSLVAYRKQSSGSIDDMIDPTKNSANEKISRIRSGFTNALKYYDVSPDHYIPQGSKGKIYRVCLDRRKLLWQPTDRSIFKP